MAINIPRFTKQSLLGLTAALVFSWPVAALEQTANKIMERKQPWNANREDAHERH